VPVATTDNFAAGRWMPGMLAEVDDDSKVDAANRGRFSSGGYWGWATHEAGNFDGVLQGWACPIKSNVGADTFTIDFTVRFNTVNAGDQTRFASVFIADDSMKDAPFLNSGGTSENGYNILCRKSGGGAIFTVTAGVAAQIGVPFTSTAIADGGEGVYRVTITPTAVRLDRLDVAANTSANNTAFRGGYFHFGRAGAGVEFRNVTVA
jgi:hypothetical protein